MTCSEQSFEKPKRLIKIWTRVSTHTEISEIMLRHGNRGQNKLLEERPRILKSITPQEYKKKKLGRKK